MFRISGIAWVKVPYTVVLNMTEAEFDAHDIDAQDKLIKSAINGKAFAAAEIDSIDILKAEQLQTGEEAAAAADVTDPEAAAIGKDS